MHPWEGHGLLELVRELKPGGTPRSERLVIKSAGRLFFLRTDEIDWVEAAGVYVELHAGGRKYLHRASLTELEAQLDPDRFIRIHRSSLVNIESV